MHAAVSGLSTGSACTKLSSGTKEVHACCSAWGCSQPLLLGLLHHGHVKPSGILSVHLWSQHLRPNF